jgi:hypothetical protein
MAAVFRRGFFLAFFGRRKKTDKENLLIQFWMNNDLHVFHGSFLHSGLIVEP